MIANTFVKIFGSFCVAKQKMEFLKKTIKYAVSGNRKRFVNSKYDLDLTYITPNVIGMICAFF